jgi:pimeloyl-ACP methyl ester carboxylesterase
MPPTQRPADSLILRRPWVAKLAKFSVPPATVRTRRAYFDCRFGQLHVRTGFPATGGFDEGVTLICLHHNEDTSRAFARFLPEIADDRSVYAPDLPGYGESDPAPSVTNYAEAAAAIVDLAKDLRLRQVDVLGMRFGAGVALELAACQPELVRRLVLVGAPQVESSPVIKQECLVMRIKLGTADDSPQWVRAKLPKAKLLDVTEYAADLFDAAPKTLAKQIRDFLKP